MREFNHMVNDFSQHFTCGSVNMVTITNITCSGKVDVVVYEKDHLRGGKQQRLHMRRVIKAEKKCNSQVHVQGKHSLAEA